MWLIDFFKKLILSGPDVGETYGEQTAADRKVRLYNEVEGLL